VPLVNVHSVNISTRFDLIPSACHELVYNISESKDGFLKVAVT
jgi:hypothetical protein